MVPFPPRPGRTRPPAISKASRATWVAWWVLLLAGPVTFLALLLDSWPLILSAFSGAAPLSDPRWASFVMSGLGWIAFLGVNRRIAPVNEAALRRILVPRPFAEKADR